MRDSLNWPILALCGGVRHAIKPNVQGRQPWDPVVVWGGLIAGLCAGSAGILPAEPEPPGRRRYDAGATWQARDALGSAGILPARIRARRNYRWRPAGAAGTAALPGPDRQDAGGATHITRRAEAGRPHDEVGGRRRPRPHCRSTAIPAAQAVAGRRPRRSQPRRLRYVKKVPAVSARPSSKYAVSF